jgi:hypothetical protein
MMYDVYFHNPMQAEGAAWGEPGGGASGGRNMNNPVQVARSDTQLGDRECAKENPRGEQAMKKVRTAFRAECTANGK